MATSITQAEGIMALWERQFEAAVGRQDLPSILLLSDQLQKLYAAVKKADLTLRHEYELGKMTTMLEAGWWDERASE